MQQQVMQQNPNNQPTIKANFFTKNCYYYFTT